MRDEALALVSDMDDPTRKLNLLREYLQAFVLRSLHESEAFRSLAFVGGTALRFLENIPRFSEDLDFCLLPERPYDPEQWLRKTKADLELSGFDCTVSWNGRKTVNVAWFRVAKLMYEAKLTHRADQKLSVKLEIDTRPKKGAELTRTVVNRHMTFVLCHYTLSSLMAGKVHALITRSYPKGRDWYDLIWYRAHRPPIEPNLDLLQAALDQTRKASRLDAKRWPEHVRRRLATIELNALVQDVRDFLERPADRALLTLENIESVLPRR